MDAIFQIKTTTKNSIGEKVTTYVDDLVIQDCFLDFTGGDSSFRSSFKGKLEETTHILICDYKELNVKENECRLVINNKIYDVLLIDDPCNLHEHLEIYLKYNEVNN